jgi:Cd2+/Zn2+-exporting ATPase
VNSVEVVPGTTGHECVVNLSYDPRLMTVGEVEQTVRDSGFCLRDRRAKVVLPVVGMTSARQEHAIEAALRSLPGVTASASFASSSIRVEFDREVCSLPQIALKLGEMGIRVAETGTRPRVAKRQVPWWSLSSPWFKLACATVAAVLLLAGAAVHWMEGPGWARAACLIPAFVLAGWWTARETFHTLRHFRFDIDVLMFAAALGASALGHYEEGVLLLVLFALGGAGEELAMDRARSAIQGLAGLAPETALVIDPSGQAHETRIESVRVGDRVLVRPYDRVPVDGRVLEGHSAVDESTITGESIPVEKSAGSEVFAGTMNGAAALTVEVRKPSEETTLSRVIRMVQDAQTTKSPTQILTDRVERWYVPLVLLGTGLLIVVPPLAGVSWSTAFYRAMAFLTAASPCALAIGTPAAVLSGIARAARLGVLIKGGVHLENMGRVRAIAFDKTGTLTFGKPRVTDVVAWEESEATVMSLAAGLEEGSNHPLARAILAKAQEMGIQAPEARDVRQEPGVGMSGLINGKRVNIGKPAPSALSQPRVREKLDELGAEGKSTVVLESEGRVLGIIAAADQIRPTAAPTISALSSLGIERTIMISGDAQAIADSVGRVVGIDERYGRVLPEEKVHRVDELLARYGHVAMVGDGVNDAPALARATVGIAMGGAGTDAALESADVALMSDDLSRLPDAIGLSRFSRRVILQNLVIALGVIAVLAPAAAMGWAPLGLAVLFHEGSTVLVVLNAIRLLGYRPARITVGSG